MKIVGLSCGTHDVSYCVFENGKTLIHEEYERISRVKEGPGDGIEFFLERQKGLKGVDIYTHYFTTWKGGIKNRFPASFEKLSQKMTREGSEFVEVSHHKSHAANAFFSSNFDEALIVSIDGGGEECDFLGNKKYETSFAVYHGKGNKIITLNDVIPHQIGGVWNHVTNRVLGLSAGPPIGNQCGTVMAMGAVSNNPMKYFDIMDKVLRGQYGHIQGIRVQDLTEEDKFDVAGSLQIATEKLVVETLSQYTDFENICVVGGCALNGLMNAAILNKLNFKNIYIPPVPYDAGCAIGCCQYIYHQIAGFPRTYSDSNETPYLGRKYLGEEVSQALKDAGMTYKPATDDEVISLLGDQKIISVFNGRSESGRRALGNRSILADPRSPDMKSIINEKVKHRQWFRPFAPMILREAVGEWFENDVESPYMNIISKFKQEKRDKVPAVVHKDGTGRFQSVKRSDNPWAYNFLRKWEVFSDVPILLNTSFNDREPIVETPRDAINCFLKTDIDYLYFPEHRILVEK